MLQDIFEKMGSRKLLNTNSSPPIAYKRYSNICEEQKPLQQQQHSLQQQQQQNTGNNRQCSKINSTTTTCLLIKHNTNTMFIKLRNCFTNFRTKSSSSSSTSISAAVSASASSQKHYSQQPRKRHHHHQHYRHEKLTECNSIPIAQSSSNMLNIVCIAVTLVFLASINGVTSTPVFVDNPSLAQFQSGRNIRHLPCIVRKSGRSGVCMFAIDCIKQNGTHLGTCIDRFYFGSCCDIKQEEFTEIADNSIDQNTISHHFTPDSSTIPTSTLFKITTISPVQQQENSSITSSSSSSITSSSFSSSITSSTTSSKISPHNATQILNSATETLAYTTINNKAKPTTALTSSSTSKPAKRTTTVKPSQQPTTHKQSHFVIRTTAKPTKNTTGVKPYHTTTIKKKTTPSTTTKKNTVATTTTTTTTKRPILTTTEATQQKEDLFIETTTAPEKLITYQIVETTAFTPTEVTNIFDFVTTERIQEKTTKPPQTTTTTQPKTTTTIGNHKETTTSTTEAVTTHKITTMKPKPQTTRKPTTSKKPTSFKRTTVRPTRRPITTTSSTTTTTTTMQTESKTPTTSSSTQSFIKSTTNSPSSTLMVNKTTLSPRPKPKPTASIVKVPKPDFSTSARPTSSSSTTITTTTTSTPTTITTTQERTTTEAEKLETTTPTPSSTTKTPEPTTASTTTTTTSSTTSSTTAKPTISTTTTTPKPTATTTLKVTYKPLLTSTTHKPGLVTWTNIDGEPVDPNEPIISDWVPVTSQAPLNTNNKVEETSSENVTFEEMDVSVSSSVTAVMNNTTIIISPPQKPVLVAKPTTTTTSTTTSTENPTTTSPPFTDAPSMPSGTEQPIESSTLTESSTQFSTEGLSSAATTSPIALSTEEVTTESSYLNFSSTTPITGLEGVDYRQVCGRRMFPEPRIVGGSNAAFGRWPWQISLRQWRTSTYLHKCGAALLNENWAITAAHCVDNVPPSDLLLRLGEYDLAEEEEPYIYQERRVQIVASHPQFDPRTFEYDLALLRFYEPVVFQPNIIPVCVPENDENFIGQTAFVTGWGRLYEDGPLPSVLQEVAVPVINNTICESMYRAAGYIEHIPHIFICAGWKKGGYDSCEGDSGGPMVLQRESDKRFQLGGVISWGIGCAEANQPGVYTRISEFRDWINQILQF